MSIDHTPRPRGPVLKAQPTSGLPGVLARSYARGTRIALHSHPDGQLLFASQGLMQVATQRGCWFAPPERAVWIPPRLEHTVDVMADIDMRSLFIPPATLKRHPQAARFENAFVVSVGPLLRTAIETCHERDTHPRLRELLMEVVLFQIATGEDGGTWMPLPADPRARRVAELVLADPANNCELDELARQAGSSARTVSRLFSQETELNFKAWRQRARIMLAAELLGRQNASVKLVAARLGFSSVAAFSHSFRQVTAVRPSEILGHKS
jgi:AraC-like DNA-binding protein/quercetin dioxygenase-like cupin family protein